MKIGFLCEHIYSHFSEKYIPYFTNFDIKNHTFGYVSILVEKSYNNQLIEGSHVVTYLVVDTDIPDSASASPDTELVATDRTCNHLLPHTDETSFEDNPHLSLRIRTTWSSRSTTTRRDKGPGCRTASWWSRRRRSCRVCLVKNGWG